MTREHATSGGWDNVLSSLVHPGGRPNHTSVARGLSEWIDQGLLPPGTRLPSTRTIARKLGVGRNTVLFALSSLTDNGYLESHERSGFFVGRARASHLAARAKSPCRVTGPDWHRRLNENFLAIPETPPVFVKSESDISFRLGEFDLDLFPISEWRECERVASGVREIAQWGRDMVDGDDSGLINQIRMNILPLSGIWARPDEILITVGAQEGRYLVSQLLALPGARIGIENPCSLDLARTIGLTGADIVGLDLDDMGVIPSATMDSCEAVVITPAHQNPTTVALSPDRRREILERADSNDFIIIEDGFETEFLSERGGPPALKSEDQNGRVIYIGTLSRLMAPGLRIGFIVAPAVVLDHLRRLRRLVHRHAPANTQRSLAIFIERGYYRRFVRRTSQMIEDRRAALIAAAERHLPEFRWRHQQGTSCFWCEMPAGLDSEVLAQAARKMGVIVDPGKRFFQPGERASNCLRLTIAGVREDRIDKGIHLLAQAFHAIRGPVPATM